jgi:glycosyltransferase involved in cell wall biosynthesis
VILQVITDPDRRGAQIFALDLQAELQRRGSEVDTVALGPGAGPDELPVVVLGPARTSLRTLRALVSRARRADVVVAHGSTTLFVGAIAATLARRPFVYRQISDSHFWANRWSRRLRVRSFLKAADAVVALWHESAATLVDDFGVDAAMVTVIPNAVPAGRVAPAGGSHDAASAMRSGLDVDDVVAAFVGALVAEKGVDDVIRALPPTVARLLVAGSGPEAARWQQLADEIAPGRVRFLGSVDDVSAVYHAADFFVFPSRGGDSMPAVVIEAGLAYLPVVVSDSAALPEMVVDGHTGLVVTAGDVGALRLAMNRLSVDGDLRAQLGQRGQERCSEIYGMEAVGNGWARLLEAFDARGEPGQTVSAPPAES